MKGVLSLNRLKLLAAISLITLFVFLVFWNIDNYRRNVSDLRSDLSNQMELACSEYRDSVVQVIFKTVEKNSIINSDNRFPSSLILNSEQDNGRKLQRSRISLRLDSLHSDTSINSLRVIFLDSLDHESEPHKEVVAWKAEQSGRFNLEFRKEESSDTLVIVKDIDSRSNLRTNTFIDKIPSTFKIIDTLFRQNLIASDLPTTYELIQERDASHTIKIPFAYSSIGFDNPPIAAFSQIRGYLIYKMLPSLLLSIVIFTLLALSIALVFRNILAQRRLTVIKNEFISNMTHELKTPIATVGVAIEALEKFGASDDPNKKKEYIDICKHEVNRLSTLVNKVMRLSFNDQAEQKLNKTHFNFREILNDTVSNMKLQLEKKKLQYIESIDDGNYNITADKLHLTNVIYNLLDNAVKYSLEHSKISVSLSEQSDTIQMKIKDEGIGIPSEYQSKIFDRFFRVPSDSLHDVKGHGLGLHYVRSIIESHGGQVSVDSNENQGTTFTIILPR